MMYIPVRYLVRLLRLFVSILRVFGVVIAKYKISMCVSVSVPSFMS